MRGDIRAEERENMKSVCVYDHKWKESTPAVTCLCQLYSQFLCQSVCVCRVPVYVYVYVCVTVCSQLAMTGFNYAANFDSV